MGRRGFLFALVFSAASVASAQTRYVDATFAVSVTPNVKYGEATNSQGVLQDLTLDVYQPAEEDPPARGAYVWIHGGNFRVGKKEDDSQLLRDFASRGWVGVSINYRLRPELPGNAAIGALTNPASLPPFLDAVNDARHDAQAAVRWVRANAGTLGVDPDKIAVGGMSAGAITALMVAFNDEDPGTSGTPGVSSTVAAAVSHAGAYAPVLLGDVPKPGDPPIAIYHGTSDEQVPYPLAPLACILNLAALNDCEYVTFLFENHRTLGVDLSRDFLYRHVILGRSDTRVPFVAELEGDPIKLLAGVEPAGVGLGVSAGVVSTTDPQKISDNTEKLVNYVLGALSLPAP